MAEKIAYQIDVNTKNAQKSLGELEKDFEELNRQIKEAPRNSKEFNRLQKDIAATGREVKNLELSFEALDNEQVASELGSVAGAVGDVSAAFILLGDDSETLQEVAKNIELAMGVSMGLKGAIEGVSSARKLLNNSTIASNILQKANTVGLVIATAAQKAYAFATTIATGAIKLFTSAVAATGIGAIVLGLVALVLNFDKVTSAIMVAVKWLANLGKSILTLISYLTPVGLMIRGIGEALIWLGVIESEQTKKINDAREKRLQKTREESAATIKANNEKIKSVKEYAKEVVDTLDWEIRKRTAAGEDVAELELKKLNVLRNSAAEQVKLMQSTLEQTQRVAANSDDQLAGISEVIAKKALENQKNNLKEANQNIEIAEIEKAKKQADYTEAEGKRREEAAKKRLEQQKEAAKKRQEARDAENEKERLAAIAAAEELERLRLEQIAREQEELQNQLEREEAQFQLLRDLRQSEQENEQDDLIESYAAKFELANGNAELELALQDQLNKDLAILNDKYRKDEAKADEKQVELTRLNNKQRIEMGSEALGALSTLVDAFSTDNEQQAKRQFKVNKALNLAQATTNTALAVTGALAEPSLVPGARFAKAAIAGTLGAANIVKIASTQYGDTGGGGGSVSLGNTASATGGANVPSVTNTTTTLDGDTKVFVTEQDISSTQNKVQVAENIATV